MNHSIAETARNEDQVSFIRAAGEVFRVALPLMISAGMFSLVLFADRTLLLWYDGPAMSASMAGGNLFWVLTCLPVGITSMTGAIVSQYVGANERGNIGRFLWQSLWLSFFFMPLFAIYAYHAPWLFTSTGQPTELISLEVTYLRILMFGAAGMVLETALSGFFSGTERTSVIMWVSLGSGLLNLLLDFVLIFGFGPIPAMGIAGAAIGSVAAFWFKAVVYAALLLRPQFESIYQFRKGFSFDLPLLKQLLFFGFPTGLMYMTEAGGFAVIVLRIGNLGDIPLRATTMAINFNMVAFIPLVGVSIAASVLVGRHLLETGPKRAAQSAYAAVVIGLIYSGTWLVAYLALPDIMMSLYQVGVTDAESEAAIVIARGLLKFVAIYVVLDAAQLILAGALRGAGDTWFVLVSGLIASVIALAVGFIWEPTSVANPGEAQTLNLNWWWWMITLWIWLLASLMAARFLQGKWKQMRMV
ncbi:MAG: MATE family efflux transporter [Rubripirellula sp.]